MADSSSVKKVCGIFLGVLDDEDDPETLINVNMVDAEKALRNVENRKKKPDYNPYDDAEEDEYGMVGYVCSVKASGMYSIRLQVRGSNIEN